MAVLVFVLSTALVRGDAKGDFTESMKIVIVQSMTFVSTGFTLVKLLVLIATILVLHIVSQMRFYALEKLASILDVK